MSASPSRFAKFTYRHRWSLSVVVLGLVATMLAAGIGRVSRFSDRVTTLDPNPSASPPPRLFDPRTDIWFDPEDSGLRAYYAIEDHFVGEDIVSVAFEEREHPWGVFAPDALASIARVTEAIESLPNVRNVRSLTTNPWIRWGEAAPGEEGLLVGDLFEDAPESYSEDARLERMIAVLGAERAASLVGEARVREAIGPDANFTDHMGEPRLMRAVISEDGRAAALVVQVLRPRASPAKVAAVFDDPREAAVGPTIHVMEEQQETLGAIESAISAETATSGYEFHVAGLPLFEREFMRVGMSDMAFVGIMFVGIALVLLLIFRRASAVAIPLLVVFSAILGMNGTVWFFGDLVNNLTATAPVMITAIGIADAVHLVTAYYLLRPRHHDRRALILEVIDHNALPVFLTSVTTAVGFFSLVTSDIVPIRMLGYTAGLGTFAAYVLSMTVVPAVLSLLPLPENAPSVAPRPRAERWTTRLANAVVRRQGAILGATALVVGLAGFGLTQMDIASDIRLMFPDDNRVRSDLTWIEDRLGGGSDLELVFYGPELVDDADAVSARQDRIGELVLRELDPMGQPLSAGETDELEQLRAAQADHDRRRIATSERFLEQVDRFERRVVEEARDDSSPLRVLTNFDSALSVLRKIHQVQHRNHADHYRVPTGADVPASAREARVDIDPVFEDATYIPPQTGSTLIAQYYLQYENGAKPSENLSALVTADRRGFRIQARTSTAPTTELLAAFARLREILDDDFPELAGTPDQLARGEALATPMLTGKQYLFTNMLKNFSDTLVVSVGLALLVITLLISLVFRSPLVGLVSILPNVLPLAIPLGFFGLIGVPLDGPAVLVATVALGVCVDDTIHFLTKFTRARRAGASVEEAVSETYEQVGAALTWTTVILVVGFGALAFSDFRPNMMIGALGAVMVALAWLVDVIVTPALLALLERRSDARAPAAAPLPAE